MSECKIISFFHCKLCLAELEKINEKQDTPISPRIYQKIQCGKTLNGWQIWCTRHDKNIFLWQDDEKGND